MQPDRRKRHTHLAVPRGTSSQKGHMSRSNTYDLMSKLTRLNPDAVPAAATRVLLALIAVHEARGRATVREVALVAGRSISVTHYQLEFLRFLGLVDWVDGRTGTLHPLLESTAIGP